MNNKPIFVKSNFTGGHYAMRSKNSSKPFTNNMKECKSIKIKDNDVVADIGAYVGEYSMWASRMGAKKVLSYEPTPHTFNILSMNKQPRMEIFNLAVVGDDRKNVDLYISKGIGVTNSIAKKERKDHCVSIDAIKYEDAVKDATIVKIDVEGAEYDYNIIQPNLRAIILEFHPIVNIDWKANAFGIMENIKNAGFKEVIKPTFKSGWNLTGSWERR